MNDHNLMRLAAGLLLAGLAGCRAIAPFDRPEPAEIESSVFLIGDAGEPDPRDIDTSLDSLRAQASVSPERNLIIFLGDNIYPDGLPEVGHAEWADARRRLEAQVLSVPPGARGIFVPGNHDWAGSKPFGLYSIRLQEEMIRTLARGRDVRMLPGNGCPGPVSYDMGRFRFVALDTQWWLHEYIVKDSATTCPTEIGEVTSLLRQQISDRGPIPGRVVVVGGHHPMMTGGEHGAYCGITGPFRRFGNRSQDIVSRLNRRLRDSMENAFSAHPPLAYAAGHDHNQQVLRGGKNVKYLLVTGAGTKVACAVRLRESYFTSQHRTGFMRLDIMKNSGVLLRVYHFDSKGEGGVAYSSWLEAR